VIGPYGSGADPPVMVAANSALFVNTAGAVVAIKRRALAGTDGTLARTLMQNSSVVDPDPFADLDQAVVVVTGNGGPSSVSKVSVIQLVDKNQAVALGSANDAAGDPQALGAFVTVAAARQPTSTPPGGLNGLADGQVELRDFGQPPVVLATAAQLNSDINQDQNVPLNLAVFPDGRGDKVAVMLNRIGGGLSNSAMVILGRNGHVLGIVGSGAGPTEYSAPYWSPDDSSLVFGTLGSGGSTLAVLNGSYQIRASTAPDPHTSLGRCTWSPDNRWIVCDAGNGLTHSWLVADSRDMAIYTVPGPGDPIAWLP
jgi:hypothetical protein